MNTILDSPEVAKLVTLVEEAARSTEEGVKRFVEPAQGTLRRATNKRQHMIFGRLGSGKSIGGQVFAQDIEHHPSDKTIAYSRVPGDGVRKIGRQDHAFYWLEAPYKYRWMRYWLGPGHAR